jgi:cytochrome c oxidase assembly protein subunit 15
MITDRTYRIWLRASITIVYLIIVAGAVVRMTGSGMGCPDWPKCFGYLIPPTEQSELLFTPGKEYEKGMVIIVDEELRVANEDFTASEHYQPSDWSAYEKHDYSVFNKFHTWTEYINRLIGALGGLVVLIMAIISLRYYKRSKKIVLLSWLAVFAMVIQAIIGKIVVDTLLSPVLITIHMIVALLIVGLLIYLLEQVRIIEREYPTDVPQNRLMSVIIVLTLIQVAMGTQVRQYVDRMLDEYGYPLTSEWLIDGPIIFYIHRSFSILLVILHAWLIYRAIKYFRHHVAWYNVLIGLLVVTILSGVIMNYFDFAQGSQAAHLVAASLILGVQFKLWMYYRRP